MSLLDPQRGYILSGEDKLAQGLDLHGGNPPKILHLKLSASVLDDIIAGQVNGSSSIQLKSLEGNEPLLCINQEQHSLQSSTESFPHQLYSLSSASSSLNLVGNITSKLSIRPDGHQTSSAATRLKERKEIEEARKSEHRTVLLDTAPSASRTRSNPSTSKLKLRKKGLAPSSTNSPLMQSRAGTPLENPGLPGSPNIGGNQRPAKTPPMAHSSLQNVAHNTSTKTSPLSGLTGAPPSPPSLQQRLIQLLAKGPMSRRNIVAQLHLPEPATLTALYQVSHVAPDHMQPPIDATKKFSGPVNRRSSSQMLPGGGNGERGASTMYILKDEQYSQVIVKDWADYDAKDRLVVSEHMEAALKRNEVAADAEQWKRLYPDGRPSVNNAQRAGGASLLDDGGDLSTEDEGGVLQQGNDDMSAMRRPSNSSSSIGSPTKFDTSGDRTNVKPAIKKNSTMDRLKKAAKGKGNSRSSTPVSSVPVGNAKRTEGEKKVKTAPAVEEPIVKQNTTSQLTTNAKVVNGNSDTSGKEVKKTKSTISKNSITKKKPLKSAKSTTRKDIEYTDSSSDDEEDKMEVDEPRPSRPTTMTTKISPRSSSAVSGGQKSSSTSPEGKRARHGVGSGAAFTSEPWLDVKSRKDWDRLAERFKRVFEEYTTSLNRLREEEDMLRMDLQQAQEEAIEREKTKELSSRGLQVDIGSEEREEGEASPTSEQPSTFGGISNTIVDPPSSVNVTWRNKTMKGRDRGTIANPMSFDEIKMRVRKLQETKAQLSRMKGTLQTSKGTLQQA